MPREPIVLDRREILNGLVIQLERERWDGASVDVWYIYNNGKRHTTSTQGDMANADVFAVLLALEARFDGINSQFARFASRMLQLDQEPEITDADEN